MANSLDKILTWIAYIIGIGVICYVAFVAYVFYIFTSGCGMNDGPFKAIIIDQIKPTGQAQHFDLSDRAQLLIENRHDTLSPIIMMIENGEVKWSLDMDTRNTKGYETTRIQEISNVSITKKTDPIKLEFIAKWTFGKEAGSMKIDREDGNNRFCLSW